MLTLYYAPGACSILPLIALEEAKLPYELERVDFMRGKRLRDGRAFPAVSPKGYVPALVLDDGQLLTEAAVIAQYIADQAPDAKLAPPAGTMQRVRLQEWLHFIATELHKGLGPLFSPKADADFKASTREKVAARLALLEAGIAGSRFLMGDEFTIADAYALYALRTWHVMFKQPLTPALLDYLARISERPGVRAALAAEGFTRAA